MAEPHAEVAGTAPPLWRSLLVAAILIAGLYAGRDVLVPMVLAVLLSFVLAIPVSGLQRLGLGRIFPVASVVTLAFAVIFGIGALLTTQIADLATELPRYQTTIRDKITSLRGTGEGGPLSRLVDMAQTLGQDLAPRQRKPASEEGGGSARPDETAPPPPREPRSREPLPVEIASRPLTPIETASAVVSPLLHPLATTGLVALFVVFILLQRGDLRNRFIRLVGSNDLQRTTEAMNDAASRLSRFFLTQVLLNASFGLIVGIGLWAIGVPSPVLWGILSAIGRFVPYVGVAISAGLPILLAAAVAPGWTLLVETAALFLVVEIVVGQLIEPLAYGHSTGITPVAVIASVTFWTWIWGPIGLLLATPLTVCLVVLGRHVEQMAFLDVMLGDRPPLTGPETFYQRILAGDPTEPTEQAEALLREQSLLSYYDEVAIVGLALAQADAARGTLDDARIDRIADAVTDLIDNLDDYDDVSPPDQQKAVAEVSDDRDGDEARPPDLPVLRHGDLPEPWRAGAPVLCIAGRNALDRVSAAILVQLLGKHGIAADLQGAEVLSSGAVADLPVEGRQLICLAYLDTSSPVHARYAIRRLRRKAPDATVMLACWGLSGGDAGALCASTRADLCASSLRAALSQCIDRARGSTGRA